MSSVRKQTAKATASKESMPEEKAKALIEMCEKFYWEELEQLRKLFEVSQAITFDDITAMKEYTFATNAKKTGIELLKKIAIATNKTIKPAELKSTSELIADARKRVDKKVADE